MTGRGRGGALAQPALDLDVLLVGDSPAIVAVQERVKELCASDAPVLLQGERGTGREYLARLLHYAGPRRGAPFVALKAETIPAALLDLELAGGTSPGWAAGGTLFIKGVETLPLPAQARLLELLTSLRAGSARASLRVILCTEACLARAAELDAFDPGLWAALSPTQLRIPPLRERAEDLKRLAPIFLREAAEGRGGAAARLSARGLERLMRYPFPGNVSELKQICRQLDLLAPGRTVSAEQVESVLPHLEERAPIEELAFEELVRAKIGAFLRRVGEAPWVADLHADLIAQVERPLFRLVLSHTGGNQLKAAKLLGLSRNTLRKRLAALGLLDRAPARASRRKPPP